MLLKNEYENEYEYEIRVLIKTKMKTTISRKYLQANLCWKMCLNI